MRILDPTLVITTLLLAGSVPADRQEGIHVVVTVPEGQVACSGQGTLRAEAVAVDKSGQGRTNEVVRSWPLDSSELFLDLDADVAWELSIDAPGCWADTMTLNAHDERRLLEVALQPAGIIRGELVLPSGDATPVQLTLSFQPVDPEKGQSEITKLTALCPVEMGVWWCRIPAGRVDLRLEAEGFVPFYIWDLDLGAGETLHLGRFQLVRGASLVGWVMAPAGEVPAQDPIVVQLSQESLGAPADPRLRIRESKAAVSPRGFFQLRSVPLGTYVLVVGTDSGFSPRRVGPINIEQLKEYTLEDPIVLEQLALLEIFIVPPSDPYQQPWDVDLSKWLRKSRFSSRVASSPATPGGYWAKEGLETGVYLLKIEDSHGSYLYRKEIDVTSGMPPLEIEIAQVSVKGTVTVGDEPIAATLRFMDPDSGRRVSFTAGENGTFEGLLPTAGLWNVRLKQEGHASEHFIRSVEVFREGNNGYATVEIELPNTRVEGHVVDRQGNPVESGWISVYHPDGRTLLETQSDEEGEFDVLGLEAGRVDILAASSDYASYSDVVQVELEVDETSAVELTLQPVIRFVGRVSTTHGFVPGALIRFRAIGAIAYGEVVSGPNGAFSFSLPASTSEVILVALPPGLPRRILRIPVQKGPESGPVEVAISPIGGELVIAFSLPEKGLTASGGAPQVSLSQFIVYEGAPVALHSLFDPSGIGLSNLDPSTGTFRFMMNPGIYSLCPTAQLTSDCSMGLLDPGGVLTLTYQL